jgi:hypothetical protein
MRLFFFSRMNVTNNVSGIYRILRSVRRMAVDRSAAWDDRISARG